GGDNDAPAFACQPEGECPANAPARPGDDAYPCGGCSHRFPLVDSHVRCSLRHSASGLEPLRASIPGDSRPAGECQIFASLLFCRPAAGRQPTCLAVPDAIINSSSTCGALVNLSWLRSILASKSPDDSM